MSDDIEAFCREGNNIPQKLDLEPRFGAKKAEAKLAQGQLTIFFRNAKDVDLEALKEAKAGRAARSTAERQWKTKAELGVHVDM